MMRFNFLYSPWQSFLDRLQAEIFDARMRPALCAFTATIVFLALSMGIEEIRLSQVHELESKQAARLHNDELAMSAMRTSAQTVRKLSALQQRVSIIQNSGNLKALELAEIGNSLPEHAWLTSIRQDHDTLIIHGGAQSYAIVGEIMKNFARTRMLVSPMLFSCETLDPTHQHSVNYEIHVQERAL